MPNADLELSTVCSKCKGDIFRREYSGCFIHLVCVKCGCVVARFLNDEWF